MEHGAGSLEIGMADSDNANVVDMAGDKILDGDESLGSFSLADYVKKKKRIV
jgi:hypothetical protein